MTALLSPYCMTVSSFFDDIAWSGASSIASSDSVTPYDGSMNSADWRCTSVEHFFRDVDWTRRRETFASTHTSIVVIHPMAMPVGHFFREFGQLASPRKFR